MSAIVLNAIRTALTEYLPERMDTPAARLMMLAIQKQEDPEERRYQLVKRTEATAPDNIVGPKSAKGPARSLWQMEAGGGVKGVLTHSITDDYAKNVCQRFNVPPTNNACWLAMEENDVLSACFARLLLWSDPMKLPKINDSEGAFDLYLRTWRPGAYSRGDALQRNALMIKFLKNHASARLELNLQ